MNSTPDRYRGCLLGGAIGDALGAPVEFLSRTKILERFGPSGITDYAPAYGRIGAITDDTQMTLFTAEGMLRAWTRKADRGNSTYAGVVAHAYQRWLVTQGELNPALRLLPREDGWLIGHRELHHPRAPGNTCLSALRSMSSFGALAVNSSKGCGGVMRVAPVGLYFATAAMHGQDDQFPATPEMAFDVAAELAALTHGHPTGFLTAGVFAAMVMVLAMGGSLDEAIDAARRPLGKRPSHEETAAAIDAAVRIAKRDGASPAAIAKLGQGWVAEESLAIALYCAMVAEDFRHGVLLAVNHDGDSDSTGAMAGNLLGAMLGVDAIPGTWIERLELREVIEELAVDLRQFREWRIDGYGDAADHERVMGKYPPN